MLFEQSAEIVLVVIAHHARDLLDVMIGIFKKVDRTCDTKRDNVLDRRYLCDLFEGSVEPAVAHVAVSSVILDADILIVVFIEVMRCTFNLVQSIRVKLGTFLQKAVDDQEDVTQIHVEQILVVDTAELKLLDHLLI